MDNNQVKALIVSVLSVMFVIVIIALSQMAFDALVCQKAMEFGYEQKVDSETGKILWVKKGE